MEEELSEELPFESENWKRESAEVLKNLNDGDEPNFLKCMGEIQREIPLWMAENLLTTSAQRNFQQAVTAILKRFKGKYLNVREAARTAVQNGNYVIFEELLKVGHVLHVEPREMANDLILSVCVELGAPRKQGVDHTSNLLKCLELILEQNNVDVRCTDKEGNTPLHYAARANNRKAMSLLLKRGSYIGHMNTFNVPPIIHIPECTLSDYFDDCLKMTENQTNEYVIESDYRCLMPHNIPAKQDTTHRPTCETEVLLYIARNKDLNHLLKHPLLSSFLYHKWCKIRCIMYTNIVFYGIFYFLLNTYILNMTYESSPNENGSQTVNNSCDVVLDSTLLIRCYLLWFFVILLWLLFTIREILLFACCPCRYLMNWENWLHVVLIIFTLILLCDAGVWCRVVVIILSALVLTTLISQHPKISTNIERFWIICRNYVCLLLPYLVLIIAFVLSFDILFENKKHFSNPGDSLFKTLIMVFTGEFNSNDIPVDSHPVLSSIVLVLFAFFIFVLVNVINGPAVSNTEEIRSEAELNGLISRVRLIVYLENIAFGEPFSWLNWFSHGNSCLLRWKPFSFLINRICLFPHYFENDKITFVYTDIIYVHPNSANYNKHWSISKMDPDIIKEAKRIISDKNRLSQQSHNEKITIALNKKQETLTEIEEHLKILD